jgi:hypothetical protein
VGSLDYIVIGTDDDFETLCVNGCTFSNWVKKSDLVNGEIILGRWDGTSDNSFFYLAATSSENLQFHIDDDGDDSDECFANAGGAFDIALDEWTHIVGVYNTTDALVYKNGVLGDTTECSFGSIVTGPGGWGDSESTFISAIDDGAPDFEWNGSIDEVMIFNTSLSSAQILDIYNNQSARFNVSGVQRVIGFNITKRSRKVNITTQHEKNLNTSIRIRIAEINESWDDTMLRSYQPLEWGNGNDISGFFDNVGVNSGTWSNTSGKGGSGGFTMSGIVTQDINVFNSSWDMTLDGNYTWSMWIKPSDITDISLLSILDFGSNLKNGMVIDSSSKLRFVGANNTNITSLGSITNNIWQMVTLTYNDGKVSLYINGSLSNDGSANINPASGMIIEYVPDKYAQPYEGVVDVLSFWNRSLSTTEIAAIYTRQNANLNVPTYRPYQNISWDNNTFDMNVDTDYLFVEYQLNTNSSAFYSPIIKGDITIDTYDTIIFEEKGSPGILNKEDFIILNHSDKGKYANLFAYYAFDADIEETTDVVSYDYSRNSLNGTMSGDAVASSSVCMYGECLNMTEVGFDSMNVTTTSKLNELNDDANFSVSMWYYIFDSAITYNYPFFNMFYNTTEYFNCRIWLGTSAYSCQNSNDGIVKQAVSNCATPTLNEWQHAVFAFNETNVSFYHNGEICDVTTYGTDGQNFSGTPDGFTMYFGASSVVAATKFPGYMDEIMVFDQTITSGDVKVIYENITKRFPDSGDYSVLFDASQPLNITINTSYQKDLSTNLTLFVEYYNGTWQSSNEIEVTGSDVFNITSDSTKISINYTLYSEPNNFYTPILFNYSFLVQNGTADTTAPTIDFENPTPSNGSVQNEDYIYVNVSSTDANNISIVLNFNNSIVGWWRMDDYNSTHYHDFIGEMDLENNSVDIEAGMFGEAGDFDGTNSYLNTSNQDLLNPASGIISVCAWIKADSFGAENKIIVNNWFPGWLLIRQFSSSELIFRVRDTVPSSPEAAVAFTDTTNWHHVCGVNDGVNVSIYLDKIKTEGDAISGYDPNTDEFQISGFQGSSGFWDGQIDDVIIYNRSLSQDEIDAMYTSTSPAYLGHNFTNLTAANYTINAWAQDESANINSTGPIEINITSIVPDTTPPESNSPADQTIEYQEDATIEWVLTDDVGVGNYSVLRNGTIQNATSFWINNTNISVWVNATALGDWNYTIYFNDSTGNPGAQDEVLITVVDTTPPVSNNPSDIVGEIDSAQSIPWNITDNFAPGEYTILRNDSIQNSSSAWANFTNLAVWVNMSSLGDWNYTIYYNDSQGNSGAQDEVLVRVQDTTAPTSNSPADITAEIDTAETIDWVLTDGVAGGQYRVLRNDSIQNASSAWVSGVNLQVWANTSALGHYNYTIYFNDSVGNPGVQDEVLVIIVDTSPPFFTGIVNQSIIQNQTFEFFVNATDYETGIGGYSVNDTDFTINETGWLLNTTILTAKIYYLNITANNTFGATNWTIMQVEVNATIDFNPPGVVITSPTNSTFNTVSITFTVVLNETGDTCITSLDGFSNNNTMSTGDSLTYTFINSSMLNGTFEASFWCNDTSGNQNGTESVWFTVLFTPPAVPIPGLLLGIDLLDRLDSGYYDQEHIIAVVRFSPNQNIDSNMVNSTIYYSNNVGKLVYKDLNGTVHPLYGADSYGGLSVNDNSNPTVISGSGEANKVQYLFFDTNDPSSGGVTPDHTQDHIIINMSGDYVSICSVTADSVAGAGAEFSFDIYVNNGATLKDNLHAHRSFTGGGGEVGSISVSGIATFNSDDTFELWVHNEDNTQNIIITDVTCSLNWLG